MNDRKLQGAAAFTHGLKEYSNGKSMLAGLERLTKETRQAGRREGFQQGFEYALRKLNLLERIIGHKLGR